MVAYLSGQPSSETLRVVANPQTGRGLLQLYSVAWKAGMSGTTVIADTTMIVRQVETIAVRTIPRTTIWARNKFPWSLESNKTNNGMQEELKQVGVGAAI